MQRLNIDAELETRQNSVVYKSHREDNLCTLYGVGINMYVYICIQCILSYPNTFVSVHLRTVLISAIHPQN